MAHMKDLTQFRHDLRAWMVAKGMSQVTLAKLSGVDQASISRFLRTENPDGLSGESVLRLYRFAHPVNASKSSLSSPASENLRGEEDFRPGARP